MQGSIRTVMLLGITLLVAVAALVYASTSVAASTAGWKKFAQANDSSEYYASAMLSTKVRSAKQVRIVYSGSGVMEIDGYVSCMSIRGFSFETRDFTFHAKRGQRIIPLPLKNADCTYVMSASLDDGGSVAFQMWAYR